MLAKTFLRHFLSNSRTGESQVSLALVPLGESLAKLPPIAEWLKAPELWHPAELPLLPIGLIESQYHL